MPLSSEEPPLKAPVVWAQSPSSLAGFQSEGTVHRSFQPWDYDDCRCYFSCRCNGKVNIWRCGEMQITNYEEISKRLIRYATTIIIHIPRRNFKNTKRNTGKQPNESSKPHSHHH